MTKLPPVDYPLPVRIPADGGGLWDYAINANEIVDVSLVPAGDRTIIKLKRDTKVRYLHTNMPVEEVHQRIAATIAANGVIRRDKQRACT